MNSSLFVLEDALRAGDSLQPILDSVGVAEMTRLMEKVSVNLIEIYFRSKAAEFTDKREIVTCRKLFQSAFSKTKRADRFYGTPMAELVGQIADAEFERQKLLFRQQNRQQMDVRNDVWQLFYLTGPNLRSNSYNFTRINSASLRLEIKYFMLWYLRNHSCGKTPVLAAAIKGVNFLSGNNSNIHYFADITDVDIRKLYNYLENDFISHRGSKLSIKSVCNTIRACSQITSYLCGSMRDKKLRTPIPAENPFAKYRFFNMDSMCANTEILPDPVAMAIEKYSHELNKAHRTLYSIFANTGLRLSEVILLKEDCLTASRYDGLKLLRYVPYKTLAARRKHSIGDICEMLIPTFLSKEIERQIQRTRELRERYSEPYIFIAKNSNHRPTLICREGFCNAVNRLIEKHHITDENGCLWSFTTRQFRKTIAVTLVESGASVTELAYWLSHLSRRTSLKYYSEVRKQRLAEMNTAFFRKKFELLLSNEQLDQFSEEQRRLLFVDFRLEQRRVELGFCMRVFANGECKERNRVANCVNCKNLCTGKPYLRYWAQMRNSQRAVVDGLVQTYHEMGIADYPSCKQYRQEKALLDAYSEMVTKIEAAFGGEFHGE